MKTIKLVAALCLYLAGTAPTVVRAQTTVRIAFNGFGGVAPLYLGQETGIFKKQGLNLELYSFPAGRCHCRP